MTLPMYLLRRWSLEPAGRRLPKITTPDEVAGTCATCSKTVVRKKLLGQMQLAGLYRNGSFYHVGCQPTYDLWNYRESRESIPTTYAGGVPVGNLAQQDYRYWIGTARSDGDLAICRACGKSTYNLHERDLHHSDPKFVVDGDQCTTRLVKAYKVLLERGSKCIICMKDRFNHSKWGVPLCMTSGCEKKWKFSHDDYPTLSVELDLQIKKAEFRAKQRKTNELALLVDALNRPGQTAAEKGAIRKWCNDCHMLWDNPTHRLVHGRFTVINGDARIN